MFSSRVDEDDFAVFEGRHLQYFDILDGDAVAGVDAHAVDFHRAGSRDKVTAPTLAQSIFGALAGLDRCARDASVGADRQAVSVVCEARGQGDETARPLAFREGSRAPVRLAAGLCRLDPDLEDLRRLRFEII